MALLPCPVGRKPARSSPASGGMGVRAWDDPRKVRRSRRQLMHRFGPRNRCASRSFAQPEPDLARARDTAPVSQEAVFRVRELYAAFHRGDGAAALGYFAPDVVLDASHRVDGRV